MIALNSKLTLNYFQSFELHFSLNFHNKLDKYSITANLYIYSSPEKKMSKSQILPSGGGGWMRYIYPVNKKIEF